MTKNYKDQLIRLLKRYKKEDITIDSHAELRAKQRNIDLDEVYDNLLNPSLRLSFANLIEDEPLRKYKCYFGYSKTQCHIYIIIINDIVLVKTIVKLNKRWQKRAERYGMSNRL